MTRDQAAGRRTPIGRDGGHGNAGGIYIHVPFCMSRCAYCDFFSTVARQRIPSFTDALIQELSLRSEEGGRMVCDSIYFGGGTPSLLPTGEIDRILSAVHRHYSIADQAEITIEANPGSVTPEKLQNLRRLGINRINLGIQSFQDRFLQFLGRAHTAETAHSALDHARQAGFENLGIDLIYGMGPQTEAQWLLDLETAVALSPEHLACYLLTIEPGTPLAGRIATGACSAAGEIQAATLFDLTHRFLPANGFPAYEISNFARSPSFRSRHNQKYWRRTPYLGFGPAAHSHLPPRRFWNAPDLDHFISALSRGIRPSGGEEILTREQEIVERIYLGLRTCAGIDCRAFQHRFQIDISAIVHQEYADLLTEGMVAETDHRLALTRRGMRFSDSIVERLVCREWGSESETVPPPPEFGDRSGSRQRGMVS